MESDPRPAQGSAADTVAGALDGPADVPLEEATVLPGAALAHLDVDDAEAVLRALSARLLELGAVTDSFEQAVLERERRQPTGLPTLVPAAIPHTDPEHVLTAGFAVATLEHSVPFAEIGSNGSREVEAELVVMLVLKDPAAQLEALQNLVAKLQDRSGVRDVLTAADDAELERAAREWLGS